MALFSTSRQQQSNHLVEFRAGKMYTRGGGETGAPIMVHPDKRKGLVYIHQSDDALMHFCWKDRTSGTVEDDLIVFPDDVEFVPVKDCSDGRVFLLKFKNSPRKLFFWMQEPKTDKDDEYCRKVNELLNHPPAPGTGRSGRGGGGGGGQDALDQFAVMNQLFGLGGSGGSGGEERMDLQNALAGMDHQQLMQLLNLMGSSGGSSGGFGGFPEVSSVTSPVPRVSPPAAAASTIESAVTTTQSQAGSTTANAGGAPVASDTTSANARPSAASQQRVQVTDLSNILANLTSGSQPTGIGESAVDLESVLVASNVEDSVLKPHNEQRLLPYLPDEHPIQRTREELLHTIRSPQFRQAVDMFGTALQTGQLAPLMSQFGLPASAVDACARGDVQSVAEILEREGSSSSTSGGADKDKHKGKNKDKDKKEDDGTSTSEPPSKKDKPDDEA